MCSCPRICSPNSASCGTFAPTIAKLICLIDGHATRLETFELESYGDIILVSASEISAGKFHKGSDAGSYTAKYPFTVQTLVPWSYAEVYALLQHKFAEEDIQRAYAVFGGCIRWALNLLRSPAGASEASSSRPSTSLEHMAINHVCNELGLQLPALVVDRFAAILAVALGQRVTVQDRSLPSALIHTYLSPCGRIITRRPASAFARLVIGDLLHRLDWASMAKVHSALPDYGSLFEMYVRRSLLDLPPVELLECPRASKSGNQPQLEHKLAGLLFPPAFDAGNRPHIRFFANFTRHIKTATETATQTGQSCYVIPLNPTDPLFDGILLHVCPAGSFAYLMQATIADTYEHGQTVVDIWADLLNALAGWTVRLVFVHPHDVEWSPPARFWNNVPDVVERYSCSWVVSPRSEDSDTEPTVGASAVAVREMEVQLPSEATVGKRSRFD